jgi:hypothetical protein
MKISHCVTWLANGLTAYSIPQSVGVSGQVCAAGKSMCASAPEWQASMNEALMRG